MARHLRDKDYKQTIQDKDILQVVSDDLTLVTAVEQSAQEEMISYLLQRYDTDRIFASIGTFSLSITYSGTQLIEYSEPVYDQTVTYSVGSRISFDDNIYINLLTSSQIDPTDTLVWQFLTEDKSLYYAKLPYNEWDEKKLYNTNDNVWFQNGTYTASQTNVGNLPIQPYDAFRIVENDRNISIGYQDLNVPPNYGFNSPFVSSPNQFWSFGSTYSFSGAYPEDTTRWTKGDNRNQMIKMYLMDITLYHLHSRINPRNVPDLRAIRYDGNNPAQNGGAVAWLKRVAAGDINPQIPEIIPHQGSDFRWFSTQPKRSSLY
jgi:hypothetical protein